MSTKYIYATHFTPEEGMTPEELDEYDGWISVSLRSVFQAEGCCSDYLDDDLEPLEDLDDSERPLRLEDETSFSITTGKRAEALAILEQHSDLIAHDPAFQAFCKSCSSIAGWQAD